MRFKSPIVSHLSITNCGIETDNNKRAPYVLKLHNRPGEYLQREVDLGAQPTDYGRADKFFPEVSEFAGSDAILMPTIDTRSELAVMHLTEHERSGVHSAEHFMASGGYHEGRYYWICAPSSRAQRSAGNNALAPTIVSTAGEPFLVLAFGFRIPPNGNDNFHHRS
jgi:hypothetical protein